MNNISVRKDPFPENPEVDWYRLMIDDNPLYSYFEGYLNGDIHSSVAMTMTNMNDLHDLALSWVDLYDYQGDQDFTWMLIDSEKDEILPLLLCPDDMDFSCLVLVAEVHKDKEHVYWKRLGRMVHTSDEWQKKAWCGIVNWKNFTEDDKKKYPFGAYIKDAVPEDYSCWLSWREELFLRDKYYLRPYLQTKGSVVWLRNVNWQFSRIEYNACVEYCRKVKEVDL